MHGVCPRALTTVSVFRPGQASQVPVPLVTSAPASPHYLWKKKTQNVLFLRVHEMMPIMRKALLLRAYQECYLVGRRIKIEYRGGSRNSEQNRQAQGKESQYLCSYDEVQLNNY